MRSEKVTINLSTVELAHVDYLVDKGLYASRSDFIRLAIRRQTDEHKSEFDQFLEPSIVELASQAEPFTVIGVTVIDGRFLESVVKKGSKLSLRVVGLITLDKSVTPELIEATVSSFKVHGKLIASPEVRAALERLA